MSDLTGKTITIPADLWDSNQWCPAVLSMVADNHSAGGSEHTARLLRHLRDAIRDQHPPRMDEPDEFGAMVEAGTQVEGDQPRERRPLVRHQTSGTLQWSDEHGRAYAWSELVDPRPVRR